jgi:hypothetical protein
MLNEIQGEGDVNTIEKALCVVRHKMLEKKNIKAIVLVLIVCFSEPT